MQVSTAQLSPWWWVKTATEYATVIVLALILILWLTEPHAY
jgi:hypothetical protein